MDPADFTDDENWNGGYYELAIDLGPRGDRDSDGRLLAALTATWADPRLNGCFLDRWQATRDQERVPPLLNDPSEPETLYGFARLPTGVVVVCGTCIVRETEVRGREAHDWLDLFLPTGALERADERVGAFPYEDLDTSLAWRRPIDEWLAQVGRAVFSAARFRVALVGFEVSGDPAADDIDLGVPEERWIGYVVPVAGTVEFYPATR